MLVLSRKIGQKIRIGNGITLTVLRIRGDQVSLGFDAPEDLLIVREELIADFEELEKDVAESNKKSVVSKSQPPDLKNLSKQFRDND